jgi:hypothetical protein
VLAKLWLCPSPCAVQNDPHDPAATRREARFELFIVDAFRCHSVPIGPDVRAGSLSANVLNSAWAQRWTGTANLTPHPTATSSPISST